MEGEDIEWLSALLDNPLFSRAPAADTRQIVQRLKCLELGKGTHVLAERERGSVVIFYATTVRKSVVVLMVKPMS